MTPLDIYVKSPHSGHTIGVMSFQLNNGVVVIGASLSEPHIDQKVSPVIYVSIYLAYVRHSVNAPEF